MKHKNDVEKKYYILKINDNIYTPISVTNEAFDSHREAVKYLETMTGFEGHYVIKEIFMVNMKYN